MRWKVCGMRDEENIRQVAMLRPDLMGFIFYRGSSRFVGDDYPPERMDRAGNIPRVGVFVNQDTREILDKVERYRLNFVQLHGDETPAQVEELSKQVKVIKVISGNDLPSADVTAAFEPFISYWLIDTRSGGQYGGTGQRFDWNVLKDLKLSREIILSGGIDAAAAAEARELAEFGVAGIDVNSRAEVAPGIKDIEKLKQIYNELHGG